MRRRSDGVASSECPPLDELVRAREEPEGRSQVLQHVVSGCSACRTRWDIIALLDDGELWQNPLPEPPARMKRLAKALSAESSFSRRRGGEIARLVFDSETSGRALAVRGPSSVGRRMVFEAGSFEIDLSLAEPGVLLGHLEDVARGPCFTVDAFALLCGDDRVHQVLLEPSGDFRFDQLEPGRFDLFVDVPDAWLVIRDVAIHA